MAYFNNIPQPTDAINNSQPQLLSNFAAIKTLIDINHGTFGAADEGKHKLVTLPVQAAAPVPAAGDGCIYNKLFAGTAKNETHIHNQTQAGTANIPMSASILSTTAPVAAMQGWTYLPSGIQMRWESSPFAFNGLYTHTVNPAYPAFTQIFAVIPIPSTPGIAAAIPVKLVDIQTNTQFRLYSNGNTFADMLIIGV